MRRLLLLVAVAALAAAWYFALPPRVAPLPPRPEGLTAPVRGAIHVHTRRSDGTGSVEEVAAAARRAGLGFVIVTDHGDATRLPDTPVYYDGVLVLDGVEISTDDGHLVAVGLSQSPYRLGGEARDVVEDVRRLGGISIAAHPGSAKAGLRWSDWAPPVDGVEWLNGDSEWRDESRWSLARVLFTYPARQSETLATLLDRPDAVLRRWDEMTARRRVFAVAGVDAHARLGLRSVGEPYDNGTSFRVPSYEQVFRTLSIAVPDLPLSGDAAVDGDALLEAIRQGRVYTSMDAVGGPAAVSFTAASGEDVVAMGGMVPPGQAVVLRVDAQAPPGARIVLLKGGGEVAAADGTSLEHAVASAGAYRVEIRVPGAPGDPPVPWVLSNPIYVGRTGDPPAAAGPAPAPTQFAVVYDDGPVDRWRVEHSARSLGTIAPVTAVEGTEIAFRWALGGALSESPFAAIAVPAGEVIRDFDRLVFRGRASRPTRVSVQLRAPGGAAGQRWHRSVHLDETAREITVRFDDMRPRGVTAAPRPVVASVESVLFVVDTANADTGTNGRIVIDDVRYAR